MSQRLLYISGRCEHSKKILVGISQYDFLKALFKVINVDREPFPSNITSVPSIAINGQIISGKTVFEYLGKLVEGKKDQEKRVSDGNTIKKDEGQCRINDDGELEGWCGSGADIEYSIISEENDDYTKKTYEFNNNLSFLNNDSSEMSETIKEMEIKDSRLSQKRQQFDNDYERLQKERGDIENGMARK